MGVSADPKMFYRLKLMRICSITKLMGESFKLHGQALVGYEDALVSGVSSPSMAGRNVDLLEMQAAY